ncbi:ADP-ribose pyrophosphatase YjhB, NUDIX family [Paenimyroides aquimaris]|uniref:ADP-ribose pyrophosphatase YjhB, NUDIX family n=1 Tax=Paenimyroides marinum TaxID=1159016 RepID=A0A1H6JX97_9FLAO|nr:NUDIX hydrolase [Paenimyroides aquimaris]SEH65624.1 ADP-ribose pyrophosphatase YjhB, NUDIX family [Paenimyroides aquimaris]
MEIQNLKGFNVRVYALCILNNKLLTLKEPFAGKMVTKLPGGGLEFGEGTAECLKREFKEELNLQIEVGDAFYIQEHFVKSLAKDNKQLLMLYFYATILDSDNLQILDTNIQEVSWIAIDGENPFSLPVDQLVFKKLQYKLFKK